MFVLMDMEWYEDRTHWFISQVAALRIDENYSVINQYDSLVAPSSNSNPETIRWDSISFSGARKKAFMTSPDINTVFKELYNWLKPDDILVWWHVTGEEKFKNRSLLMNLPFSESRVIGEQVRKLLSGQKKKGSPFSLCLEYGIPVSKPEHCSSSDVHTFRNLLSTIRFPLTFLAEQGWRKQIARDQSNAIPNQKTFPQTKNGNQNMYCFEKKTGLLHKSTCTRFDTQTLIAEIPLRKAVTQKLTPCQCCWKEYESTVFAKSRNKVKSSIVYSTKSHDSVAHLTTCPIVKRISPANLRTLKSAEKAKNNGFRFCKICFTIDRFYNPIKPFVEKYCASYGLKHYLKNGMMYVVSQYDKWIIVIDGKNGVPTLYHKNKGRQKEGQPDSFIPGYHLQSNSAHNIPGILRDIASHDRYKGSISFIKYPKRPDRKKLHDKTGHNANIEKKRRKQADKIRFTKTDLDQALLEYYE